MIAFFMHVIINVIISCISNRGGVDGCVCGGYACFIF